MTKKSSRRGEVNGNAMASAQMFGQECLSMGERLWAMERWLDNYAEDDIFITSVRVRVPSEMTHGYLGVISATKEGASVVAFHEGATFAGCVDGIVKRMQNKSLKWRVDQYADKDKDQG